MGVSTDGFVVGQRAHQVCADAGHFGWQTAGPYFVVADAAALIRDLLHHVPDRRAVLREAWRVLQPGGQLTLIEPNGRSPRAVLQALAVRAERGILQATGRRAELDATGLLGRAKGGS